MKRPLLLFTFLLVYYSPLFSQDSIRKLTFDGYIYGLYLRMDGSAFPIADNIQIYNRLNFGFQVSKYTNISLQIRNTILFGDWVKLNPHTAIMLEKDMGFVDLTKNLFDEKTWVFNTNIDRIYYQYSKHNVDLTIGRQRINWGRTLAWNPNDIFNASSFFEFDYVEKPGSDAFRLNYYLNQTSSFDFAIKADSSQKLTYATKYAFNMKGYDIQLIAGAFHDDFVAGLGWAGNIKNIGFKGESSYFIPIRTSGTPFISATAALDYSFNNGLYLMGQVLYTDIDSMAKLSDFMSFYSGAVTAKSLSFTKWNLMGQADYPVSPIINSSFSIIYYPVLQSFFIYPMMSFSVTNDFDISVIYQYFKGKSNGTTPKSVDLNFLYFGLKYYF